MLQSLLQKQADIAKQEKELNKRTTSLDAESARLEQQRIYLAASEAKYIASKLLPVSLFVCRQAPGGGGWRGGGGKGGVLHDGTQQARCNAVAACAWLQ